MIAKTLADTIKYALENIFRGSSLSNAQIISITRPTIGMKIRINVIIQSFNVIGWLGCIRITSSFKEFYSPYLFYVFRTIKFQSNYLSIGEFFQPHAILYDHSDAYRSWTSAE